MQESVFALAFTFAVLCGGQTRLAVVSLRLNVIIRRNTCSCLLFYWDVLIASLRCTFTDSFVNIFLGGLRLNRLKYRTSNNWTDTQALLYEWSSLVVVIKKFKQLTLYKACALDMANSLGTCMH